MASPTDEHACGTMQGPQKSGPGAASTAPALTGHWRSDMAHDTPRIPRRLRFEILRRDGFTCRYCGGMAPDVALTVDHVVPSVLGGGSDPTNLVTACADCNGGKTSTSPDETIVADVNKRAAEWADALERAAEIRRQQIEENGDMAFLKEFRRAWLEQLMYAWDLDVSGWESSVLRFRQLGLTLDDQRSLLTIVARNLDNLRKPFRYFARLCWSELEARRTIAEDIIGSED